MGKGFAVTVCIFVMRTRLTCVPSMAATPACDGSLIYMLTVALCRLKQETTSPEPREPEFMHHNIGGRDFVLDARYTELKCVVRLVGC